MTRVFVADDHAIVRSGLGALLEHDPRFERAGEAASADDLSAAIPGMQCDVLVLDLTLLNAVMDGELPRFLAARPDLKILIYTMHPEGIRAARLLQSGAYGYLCKTAPVDELVEALVTVASGERYMSETLRIEVDKLKRASDRTGAASLSSREMEVLLLLAGGQTPAQIGHSLGLAPTTVSTHIRHLREKLDASSHADLVRFAVREGLV